MNWFLDMCILIFYTGQGNSLQVQKTKSFFEHHKNEKLVVCHYIIEVNLPKWFARQRMILKEILRKINDSSYTSGSSREADILYERDKQKIQKYYLLYQIAKDKKEYIEAMQRTFAQAEMLIKQVINQRAKKVIPINEIDPILRSALLTFMNCNDSDAKTLASGIQQNNIEKVRLLTDDRKDWIKDKIQWVFDSQPALAKKYPEVPEILYIHQV